MLDGGNTFVVRTRYRSPSHRLTAKSGPTCETSTADYLMCRRIPSYSWTTAYSTRINFLSSIYIQWLDVVRPYVDDPNCIGSNIPLGTRNGERVERLKLRRQGIPNGAVLELESLWPETSPLPPTAVLSAVFSILPVQYGKEVQLSSASQPNSELSGVDTQTGGVVEVGMGLCRGDSLLPQQHTGEKGASLTKTSVFSLFDCFRLTASSAYAEAPDSMKNSPKEDAELTSSFSLQRHIHRASSMLTHDSLSKVETGDLSHSLTGTTLLDWPEEFLWNLLSSLLSVLTVAHNAGFHFYGQLTADDILCIACPPSLSYQLESTQHDIMETLLLSNEGFSRSPQENVDRAFNLFYPTVVPNVVLPQAVVTPHTPCHHVFFVVVPSPSILVKQRFSEKSSNGEKTSVPDGVGETPVEQQKYQQSDLRSVGKLLDSILRLRFGQAQHGATSEAGNIISGVISSVAPSSELLFLVQRLCDCAPKAVSPQGEASGPSALHLTQLQALRLRTESWYYKRLAEMYYSRMGATLSVDRSISAHALQKTKEECGAACRQQCRHLLERETQLLQREKKLDMMLQLYELTHEHLDALPIPEDEGARKQLTAVLQRQLQQSSHVAPDDMGMDTAKNRQGSAQSETERRSQSFSTEASTVRKDAPLFASKVPPVGDSAVLPSVVWSSTTAKSPGATFTNDSSLPGELRGTTGALVHETKVLLHQTSILANPFTSLSGVSSVPHDSAFDTVFRSSMSNMNHLPSPQLEQSWGNPVEDTRTVRRQLNVSSDLDPTPPRPVFNSDTQLRHASSFPTPPSLTEGSERPLDHTVVEVDLDVTPGDITYATASVSATHLSATAPLPTASLTVVTSPMTSTLLVNTPGLSPQLATPDRPSSTSAMMPRGGGNETSDEKSPWERSTTFHKPFELKSVVLPGDGDAEDHLASYCSPHSIRSATTPYLEPTTDAQGTANRRRRTGAAIKAGTDWANQQLQALSNLKTTLHAQPYSTPRSRSRSGNKGSAVFSTSPEVVRTPPGTASSLPPPPPPTPPSSFDVSSSLSLTKEQRAPQVTTSAMFEKTASLQPPRNMASESSTAVGSQRAAPSSGYADPSSLWFASAGPWQAPTSTYTADYGSLYASTSPRWQAPTSRQDPTLTVGGAPLSSTSTTRTPGRQVPSSIPVSSTSSTSMIHSTSRPSTTAARTTWSLSPRPSKKVVHSASSAYPSIHKGGDADGAGGGRQLSQHLQLTPNATGRSASLPFRSSRGANQPWTVGRNIYTGPPSTVSHSMSTLTRNSPPGSSSVVAPPVVGVGLNARSSGEHQVNFSSHGSSLSKVSDNTAIDLLRRLRAQTTVTR